MNEARENSDSASTSPKPAMGGAVPRMALPHGPETVINPEGRPAAESPADHLPLPGPASSIVRTLFPALEGAAEGERFDASSGVSLGHFVIVERIRNGGMGAVFRAMDSRLNRIVALKILPPALTRDSSSLQRFRNEAQAAAHLDNENIARVYYIGEDQGLHFIAFEFVSGNNLRDLIQQHGRLPVSDAVNYTLQIASALLHTSAKGVVHRDIKPSNIVITPSGRAKLVDMGLARNENKDEDEADLTLAGTTLGTFDYISPEQARDPRTADVRSDIYSLGCTLYHMLTGGPPFPQGTVLQKLLQHQGDDAPDPILQNRRVPASLSAIVRKMMAKDPRRRYQSAEQLVRDLMLVAGSMGLRSLSSEGLVWMSSQAARTGFWERHLAWMSTVAALLLIVGYMQFSGVRFSPHDGDLSGSSWTERRAGNASDGVAHDADSTNSIRPAAARTAVSNGGVDSKKPQPPRGKASTDTKGRTGPAPEKPPPPARATVTGSDKPPPPLPENPAATAPGVSVALDATANGGVFFGPQSGTAFTALRPDPPDASSITAIGPASFPASAAPLAAAVPERKPKQTGDVVPSRAEPAPSTFGAPSAAGAPSAEERGTSRTSQTEDRPLPRGTDSAFQVAASRVPEAISIVGADGLLKQSFRTLEAACTAAENGSIIELRFNGRRTEGPVRITKKITIRAGKGFRPLLEFLPIEVPAEGYLTRMITLAGGSLDLVGVHLLMTVRDAVPTDQWTLFAARRSDSLRMDGVTLTVQNPRRLPAAFFELQPGLAANMPDMEMGNSRPRLPLEMEMSASLARGEGDLFLIRSATPIRLVLKESVLALEGALLRSPGGEGSAADANSRLELRLEHVTALLGGGLLKLDGGDATRRPLPVHASASNSIFTTNSSVPFVAMAGNSPPQDFRPFLIWAGRNNLYGRFETFWSIASTEGTGKAETLDFAAWRKNWGPDGEVDSHPGPIAWKRDWKGKPCYEMTASDFTLDRKGPNKPAVSGAANRSDAGADLSVLEKLEAAAVTPARDSPDTAE